MPKTKKIKKAKKVSTKKEAPAFGPYKLLLFAFLLAFIVVVARMQ